MDIEKRANECRGDRKKTSSFILEMDPFIRKVSNRYSQNSLKNYREDIYIAAQLGFYKAIEKFDYNYKGFVKYAKKSMEIEIRSLLSNDTRLIRLPRYVTSLEKRIEDYLCLNPFSSEEDIKREVSIKSERTFKTIRDSFFLRSVASLDYASFIPWEETDNEYADDILSALSTLPPLERYIVIHTFGLEGSEKLTLSLMAEKLGVTKQTVLYKRRKAYSSLKNKLSYLMT